MAKKKSDKKGSKKISEKEKKKLRLKNMNTWISAFSNLSAMAFVLFLITIWPNVGQEIVNLHWGWYLGATVLFWLLALRHHLDFKRE